MNPEPSRPTATIPARRTAFHALTVTEVTPLCADAAAITFAVPEDVAEQYRFRPGQSLTLRRVIDGVEHRRSYSICAPAGAELRIGVREVPGGLFSPWLVHQVRPGDTIEVAAPTGSFTPDVATPAYHVFIAAGSGITPVLSVAASVLANPGAQVTILYGNRRTDTVMFAEELADLKDAHPTQLELAHVLSREPREAELFSGRLDPDRLRLLLPALTTVPEVDHWWLCGPFDLVTGAIEVLTELGVASSRVHRELFYVDTPPELVRHEEPGATGPSSAVTVILDGRATPMALPLDTAILDGAQQVRPDLPFACKGGVCGTCRARVTSGKVDLRRNFALEPAEIAAGFVLTCQSYPVSDTITIDYDQ